MVVVSLGLGFAFQGLLRLLYFFCMFFLFCLVVLQRCNKMRRANNLHKRNQNTWSSCISWAWFPTHTTAGCVVAPISYGQLVVHGETCGQSFPACEVAQHVVHFNPWAVFSILITTDLLRLWVRKILSWSNLCICWYGRTLCHERQRSVFTPDLEGIWQTTHVANLEEWRCRWWPRGSGFRWVGCFLCRPDLIVSMFWLVLRWLREFSRLRENQYQGRMYILVLAALFLSDLLTQNPVRKGWRKSSASIWQNSVAKLKVEMCSLQV